MNKKTGKRNVAQSYSVW